MSAVLLAESSHDYDAFTSIEHHARCIPETTTTAPLSPHRRQERHERTYLASMSVGQSVFSGLMIGFGMPASRRQVEGGGGDGGAFVARSATSSMGMHWCRDNLPTRKGELLCVPAS